MPAKSKKMRRAMAIAEHHPEELNPENRGLLKMTHKQLHDFAATPEKGLPYEAHKAVGSHQGGAHEHGKHVYK